MKKLLLLTVLTVLFSGTAFGLTYPQAQANAMNCVELVKFSAELSSPTMNDFLLKSNKVVFDKNGSIYIIEKSLGDIKFRYFDKNKKAISGKNLREAYDNAAKNAAFVEVELTHRLLYSAKLTVAYTNPAENHKDLTIEGTVMVKSGKDEIPYRISEKILVKEITPSGTLLVGGVLKSEGKLFKDIITIDFSKNVLNSTVDKAKPIDAFNSQKRSQKIDNLKFMLAR